jgi:prolyl-tRNA editing enzyme YbaK/EbsC (Cys-tRNA(Pro) deacylase)
MAPTFILQTESGYLAAPEAVKELTGAEVGYVSLINAGIKTIVDQRLLEMEAVFGGSGVRNHTLKINPRVVVALTGAEVFDFTELKE